MHLALTQGVFAKIVADFVPLDLRGTGFGMFDLARGIAFVIANVIAGWWWRTSGPPAAFFSAAVFATIAGIGLAAATRGRSYMRQQRVKPAVWIHGKPTSNKSGAVFRKKRGAPDAAFEFGI
jgi:MFS family permease